MSSPTKAALVLHFFKENDEGDEQPGDQEAISNLRENKGNSGNCYAEEENLQQSTAEDGEDEKRNSQKDNRGP